jgi:hypothetical protein
MQIETSFESARDPAEVAQRLNRDETLLGLFPGESEIVAREPDRATTRTHYRAMGREGDAVFHWRFLSGGGVAFEKVCDGRVWKELVGSLSVEAIDDADGGSRISLELEGKTKSMVPEFMIKGPLEDQIREMSEALSEILEYE